MRQWFLVALLFFLAVSLVLVLPVNAPAATLTTVNHSAAVATTTEAHRSAENWWHIPGAALSILEQPSNLPGNVYLEIDWWNQAPGYLYVEFNPGDGSGNQTLTIIDQGGEDGSYAFTYQYPNDVHRDVQAHGSVEGCGDACSGGSWITISLGSS